jgi:hypothetical protein
LMFPNGYSTFPNGYLMFPNDYSTFPNGHSTFTNGYSTHSNNSRHVPGISSTCSIITLWIVKPYSFKYNCL